MLLGLQKTFTDFLEKFGNTVLSPFDTNGKLKLLIVMVFFPLIFNALNFWLIDNILKLKTDAVGNESIRDIYIKETGEMNPENKGVELANPGNLGNTGTNSKRGSHKQGPSIEIKFDQNFKNINSNRIYGVTAHGDMSGINLQDDTQLERKVEHEI
jgi:hypothetical protein